MRVIAGKVRRMTLAVPAGSEVRPTTDRIKETLFNIIQFDLQDCMFLDLFAGSGGIGIEALSRGAKQAVFVDKGKDSLRCIEQNLKHTNLYDDAEILPMDAVQAIKNLSKRGKVFDIVFLDPPYEHDMEIPVLNTLYDYSVIDANSLIIAETSVHTDITTWDNDRYSVIRVKKYKTNQHVFLKQKNNKDGVKDEQ